MTKWILSVGLDLAVIALWVYLDWAARHNMVIKPSLKLHRYAWWLTSTATQQEDELQVMSRQGYALNQDGEFIWIGEREA